MAVVGMAKNGVSIVQLVASSGSATINLRGTSYSVVGGWSNYGAGFDVKRGSTVIATGLGGALNTYYLRITAQDNLIKVDLFKTLPPVTGGIPYQTLQATDSTYLTSGTWDVSGNVTSISFTSMDTTSYTVNYNANGGSVSPTSAVYSGAALTLPTPTRSGYTFNGWYTAATGGTQVSSPYEPDANVTLYAHWTQDKVRTLKSLNAPVLNAQSLGVDVQRVYSFGALVWER